MEHVYEKMCKPCAFNDNCYNENRMTLKDRVDRAMAGVCDSAGIEEINFFGKKVIKRVTRIKYGNTWITQ